MSIIQRAFIIGVCCLATIAIHAKTVKTITVADGTPFTDHIAMATDATDKDLMVKFVFDESANTLTISVLSYRMLFVFWESTPYKGIIRRRWIHTDRLPYVVTAEEGQHFRLTKPLRNALPQPYKKHVFKKWIEYEGLQPQEKELKMLNDYIDQTFDIQNKRNNVTIRLRDIMLMDATRQKGINTRYEIGFGKDLNTEYQITIQRNPCFGLEKEKESAQKSLEAVEKSYKSIKSKYGKGTVGSENGKKAFDELKATLTAQFQHVNDSSACPDIQRCYEQYNLYADSLASMKVSITTPVEASEKIMGSKGSEANAKIVLSNARAIDMKVAMWLNSKDPTERMDIIATCQSIIKDTRLIISTLPAAQYKEAIKLFNNAEQYFKKTCR
jgi:hypothetical protein